MAVRAIAVAATDTGPGSYTLPPGVSLQILSVAWTELVRRGGAAAIAEVNVFDPAGNLIARLVGPPLPAPP